ncbi:C6 transcription factor [Penicillium nucicola]|uniref:C6 transcription factor n=1 Tax=Penicillium nucicola TaxID=1850975 RepID=UPI002544DB30|nr:C6 transcription factor [Penicillium nucicola]KAJ5770824.1 C6 transcription factor [Penicillium nucicola]
MEALDSSTRVRVACEMCRKRKRKCDGIQPVCHGCRSRHVECRYNLSKPPRSMQLTFHSVQS